MEIKWKLDGNPFELELLPKRFRIHLTSLPSSPLRILVPALFTSSLAALLGQTHRQSCNSHQRYYLVKKVISKESVSGDVCALQQFSRVSLLGPQIVWPTFALVDCNCLNLGCFP